MKERSFLSYPLTPARRIAKAVAVALGVPWGLSALAAACPCEEGPGVSVTAETVEVVVAPSAPSGALFAATELTNFLSRAFARDVSLVRAATPGKYPIHVGDGPAARAAGADVAKLPRDAFELKVGASGAVIAGLDDPGIDMFRRARHYGGNSQRFPRATVFGVYEFLERFAGCRFYFPGRLGEIVPRRESLRLPLGDFGSSPDFTVRYYSYMDASLGAWPARDAMTDADWRLATNLEFYRLRMETYYVPFCHGQNLMGLNERFAKTHPEWFAMDANGRRRTAYDPSRLASGSQMCLTSGYWEEIYQDAKSYLSGEPPSVRKPAKVLVRRDGKTVEKYVWRWHAQHGRYFDVMPNDGIAKCACANCRAAFARAKDPVDNWASEIIWGKTVEMANRLTREGVGGYLTQMAYGAYTSVPDFEIPTNVLVMLARTGAWREPDRKRQARDNALVKAWSEKTRGRLCLWNYPGKYECAGTDLPDVPCGTPHAMGAYLKSVAPWIVGTYQESCSDRFLFSYLPLYVFSRIAWDNSTDPEAVIAEHNRLMFGRAARTMGEYIRIQEGIWLTNVVGHVVETSLGPKAMTPSEHELWTRVYGERTVARLTALLARAEEEAGPGSVEAERVRLYRAETLAPLATRRAKYLEAVLPEREFVYRRAHPVPPGRALVPQGDFARGIAPWRRGVTTDDGIVEWDAKEGVDGPGSLRLFTSCRSTDGGWRAVWRVRATLLLDGGKVPLKPRTRYRLSYFVKTDSVVALTARGGVAAALVEANGRCRFFPERKLRGTIPWTRQAFEFETGARGEGTEGPDLRLAISQAYGEAHFDGVRLDELGPQPSSPESPGKGTPCPDCAKRK